jgi:type IV secretion system protein TrbL
MALIEFKIVTLGGFLLLPFAILDRTTSIAERALGYVIAAGLKIFALAVVVSFAFAILPNLELSEELTLTEAFTVIGTALAFLMLSIKAPGLATSLVTGGPSLGIGAVGQTVATAAGTGAAAYYTAATAGRAVMAGGRAITGRSTGSTANGVTRTTPIGQASNTSGSPRSDTPSTTSSNGSIRQSSKRAAVAAGAAMPRDSGGGGGASVDLNTKKES